MWLFIEIAFKGVVYSTPVGPKAFQFHGVKLYSGPLCLYAGPFVCQVLAQTTNHLKILKAANTQTVWRKPCSNGQTVNYTACKGISAIGVQFKGVHGFGIYQPSLNHNLAISFSKYEDGSPSECLSLWRQPRRSCRRGLHTVGTGALLPPPLTPQCGAQTLEAAPTPQPQSLLKPSTTPVTSHLRCRQEARMTKCVNIMSHLGYRHDESMSKKRKAGQSTAAGRCD